MAIVFKKDKSSSLYSYLFYVVALCFILFATWLNNLKINGENHFLNFVSLMYFVACLCIPPLFYLYIKNLRLDFTEGHFSFAQIQKHFIPAFILLIINLFSFFFLNIADKNHIAKSYVENIMTYTNVISLYFVFLIQVIFYVIASILEYKQYRKEIHHYYSFEDGLKMRWITIFVAGFIFFIFSIYFLQIIDFDKRIFVSIIGLYLLVSGYSAFKQEYILNEIHRLQKKSINNTNAIKKEISKLGVQELNEEMDVNIDDNVLIDDENPNYKTEIIEDAYIEEVYLKIIQSMEKDKIYLNPDLTLNSFALYLSTNSKYLSHTINSRFNKNFSSFINSYRVAESMRLLSSDKIETYTMETIALESGFKTRSVFISAFKKETNKTPSQYKKDLQK